MERDGSRFGRASLVDAKSTDVNQVPCDASQHLYCGQDGPWSRASPPRVGAPADEASAAALIDG